MNKLLKNPQDRAKKLIEENLKTKAPTLDLGRCGLDGTESDLYALLAKATHLKTLILGNEWLGYRATTKEIGVRQSINQGLANHFEQFPQLFPANLQRLIMSQKYDKDSTPIKNAASLRALKNLRGLYIHHYDLDDFTFLYDLPHLRELDLSFNKTKNLPDFAKLADLKCLYLRESSYLGNADFLKHLKSLETVDFMQSSLDSFHYLLHLKNLKHLYLYNNTIENIDGIEQLSQLETLNLKDNHVEHPKGIKHLTNLRNLNLEDNGLDNIDYVKNLPRLQGLYLRDNSIEDLSAVASLKNLRYLYVGSNQMEGADFLKDFTALHTLEAEYSKIQNLNFLKDFGNLHYLDLSSNNIEDISMLRHLPRLQYLYLGENEIEDIEVLENLKNLKRIELQNNHIKDISCLAKLPHLQCLNLESNNIDEIAALANAVQLKLLNVSENKIKSISCLKNLSNLNIQRFNISLQELDYAPRAFVLAKVQGGMPKDYVQLPELPHIVNIWQLLVSDDETNNELGIQLAKGQGWTPKQIAHYQEVLDFYLSYDIDIEDIRFELYL